jgi:hypothetical protein
VDEEDGQKIHGVHEALAEDEPRDKVGREDENDATFEFEGGIVEPVAYDDGDEHPEAQVETHELEKVESEEKDHSAGVELDGAADAE